MKLAPLPESSAWVCAVLRRSWLGALIVLAASTAAGCATVSPYEREQLTRPTMDTARESGEAAFHAHVNDSREGATGGTMSTGGGCGCN